MGIAALYQRFGNTTTRCIQASARLKDMQNMMPGCGDYFVMHSWREQDGPAIDNHCVVVWEWEGKITVHFYANWAPMNGYFTGYEFPMDHEIWIGIRPNTTAGNPEYTSFTWWVHDKTTDEYDEETRNTPETWTSKNMDVALEMVDENIANGLRRSMADLVCLDENNNEVYLEDLCHIVQHPYPSGYSCHKETYSNGGFKAECTQWKTHGIEPPDLIIDDIWVEECHCQQQYDCYFHYHIKNIGGTAEDTHTKLKINGVEKIKNLEPSLIGYTSRGNVFPYKWIYSGGRDTIEAIADCDNEASENEEGNNSLTKHFMCGDVTGDGKVTMSDVRKVFNRYLDPNYELNCRCGEE